MFLVICLINIHNFHIYKKIKKNSYPNNIGENRQYLIDSNSIDCL